MIDSKLSKENIEKIEEARKVYNEKNINELLSDKEENKLRKEKLDKIENGQKSFKWK